MEGALGLRSGLSGEQQEVPNGRGCLTTSGSVVAVPLGCRVGRQGHAFCTVRSLGPRVTLPLHPLSEG